MPTKAQIAEEILKRRKARNDFRAWCQLCGFEPARHHDLIIKKFQEVVDSSYPRYVIILMPPGSAKSTYTSQLAPPWFLGRRPASTILACSYDKDLAQSFGRKGRNLVEEKHVALGYRLKADTKAADEWETSNGGRYFCAGVGGGIAGHRADLGLIDDPIGSQEDAESKTKRKKTWDWFIADFYPRLKPNASIFIIANRRHEDDLIGRLTRLGTEDRPNESPIAPQDWEVINIPFFAEQNDVLGRQLGETLWPEWFNIKKSAEVRRMSPRLRAGLYQQRPAPEDGDQFKLEWLQGYELEDLPKELRYYAASDHAVSKRDEACPTCMGAGGLSPDGNLYIHPEMFWKRADTAEQVDAMLLHNLIWKPIFWIAEKEHILQSIGPFLKTRMKEERNYIPIKEVTPKKDKVLRAQSFRGLCAQKRVFFPKFALWWPEVELQLLTFPNSLEVDVVDMLAHLGKFIDSMTKPEESYITPENFNQEEPLTYGQIFHSSRRRERRMSSYAD